MPVTLTIEASDAGDLMNQLSRLTGTNKHETIATGAPEAQERVEEETPKPKRKRRSKAEIAAAVEQEPEPEAEEEEAPIITPAVSFEDLQTKLREVNTAFGKEGMAYVGKLMGKGNKMSSFQGDDMADTRKLVYTKAMKMLGGEG